MTTAEQFMQRCLDLARLGKGNVAPNPMVGSVVVVDNKIIGEGYHQEYGKAHAEVNAIQSVKDKSLLSKATIYVNLEPCAHFGKTPPCSDLIIASKIPNVVIGCIDSYSEVAGKGIARMQSAGINVKVGVLEDESLALNRRFFTFHTKKRPYVILKWAETQNGYIDKDRSDQTNGIFWITQPETQVLVHKWRHEEAAILVGKNTVKNDNPSLTCRAYAGNSPTRIIIDPKLRLDYGRFNVGDRTVKTIVLTEKEVISKGNLSFIQPASFEVKDILNCLYMQEIQSVIIEGGKVTLTHFIDSKCWDEARVLKGISNLKSGTLAPQLNNDKLTRKMIGKDELSIYLND